MPVPATRERDHSEALALGQSCVHRRGNSNASCSVGKASLEWVRLALSLNCLSYAREGPPVPRQHVEVHLVVLHETWDIPNSMAWHLSLIHSVCLSRHDALFHYHLPPFLSSRLFTHEDHRMYAQLRLPVHIGRSTLWQDQSPGHALGQQIPDSRS
ncbi:hypothetical protein RJT34_17540 [Clitoria ternatea]|uniref:Uncharacterized protein n=1 Tax=Clitoria ternatea TaxID=43366 RepID=A0AAN9PD84_CLITE